MTLFLFCTTAYFCKQLSFFQNFYIEFSVACRRNINSYGRNLSWQSRDTDPIHLYMFHRKQIQPHRPVDSRSGIPSAIRLLAVRNIHLYTIVFLITKSFRNIDIKSGISILMYSNPLTVEKHNCIFVDTLKFQNYSLFSPVFRRTKCLLVNIIMAYIPPIMYTTGAQLILFIHLHCVMRNIHRHTLFRLPRPLTDPVVIQTYFFHHTGTAFPFVMTILSNPPGNLNISYTDCHVPFLF